MFGSLQQSRFGKSYPKKTTGRIGTKPFYETDKGINPSKKNSYMRLF